MWVLGAIFFVVMVAFGALQLCAAADGLSDFVGWNFVLCFIVVVVGLGIPVVGTLGGLFLTYHGAHGVWDWSWWQAALLTAPGVIFSVGLMFGSVVASIFKRK